jgi:hypothetical protein
VVVLLFELGKNEVFCVGHLMHPAGTISKISSLPNFSDKTTTVAQMITKKNKPNYPIFSLN